MGFGTIVGSAVFNVLFVIGLCGYVAKGNIDLTWWPLFRAAWNRVQRSSLVRIRAAPVRAKDCSYYITSLAVLAAFVSDQLVRAWEARSIAIGWHNAESVA